jgi:hypothetical protein
MTRRFPPFRHFLYVLGTVNIVMAITLLLLSMAFSGGVNLVSIGFVALAVNVTGIVTVARQR